MVLLVLLTTEGALGLQFGLDDIEWTGNNA